MKKIPVSSCVLGILLSATFVISSAAEPERPAKISTADLAGKMFQGPHVKKVTEGAAKALEVDTLTSADKKFQTGSYQAGPEHTDFNKYGYPEYEFFYVLKGSIKLTDAKGVQVIGPGEAVSIPKGWKGLWDSDGYTKVWVTYDPK
jgi:uncharacterized cupin superfamily protein